MESENSFINIDFRKLHLFDAQSEKSLGYPEEIRRLNAALDFSMPDERMLTSWMMARVKAAGKTMTRDAWNEFFERSNDSMDHMDMEMEKLLYRFGFLKKRRMWLKSNKRFPCLLNRLCWLSK